MRITGTFLDEISHDIPHQNWGREEWKKDFMAMKAIGIDTVILIRCGHKRWMTFPSPTLIARGGFTPPVDLVEMFLDLADELDMKFYFGTYDSGSFWHNGEYDKEIEVNLPVVEEAWNRYGHHKSFAGWYLSLEISRRKAHVVDIYRRLSQSCKELSGGKPILISPFITGIKQNDSGTLEEHEREWDNILDALNGTIDIMAFQDGHCGFDELAGYLEINSRLARKHGITCWSNCESFDRDMPIRFLPIKWEKMLLKLEAAKQAGVEKVITFEFSHFMSPNSSYHSAGHLYNRYREYFQI
ncbi:MAG: DUF4434 domain-containing protein [Lentisphaerae bacterium]|nr:DUF4434 domain-containing protein [Lentisphaerota bacterium]